MDEEPYFFLSYARRDDSDAFVGRFYRDLVDELERLGAGSGMQPAFRDVERLGLGSDWERVLGRAVGRCRAFVALYSSSYMRSLYCGKEWTAFRDRLTQYRQETDIDVPALVPVMWAPLRGPLPDEVARLQYSEPRMGAEYAEYGLQALLRTDPTGHGYRKAVSVIADRVRHVAERFRLPHTEGLDLGTVQGCFPVPQGQQPMERDLGHVRIFVAAGTAERLPEGRRHIEYYGRTPLEWTPYHPPVRPTLAHRAQRVIIDEGCTSSLEAIDDELGRKLEAAMSESQTSILLVDAWAAAAEPYRAALADFDRQNHPVTGVLVPCHDSDEESADEALWTRLRQVFRRNWMRRNDPYDPLFRVRVGKENFDDHLAVMVAVAQSRLMESAVPRWLPEGPAASRLPELTVPAPQTAAAGPEAADTSVRRPWEGNWDDEY
ncbi:TIR-like protein FxsC [Streptomyces sp. NPDC008092]|uniref:TIR-like protein FxsC n=1 Tax=Streptomyces sp. NPDC008092 TaxID=3364808 RepID=UPI0036E81B43